MVNADEIQALRAERDEALARAKAAEGLVEAYLRGCASLAFPASIDEAFAILWAQARRLLTARREIQVLRARVAEREARALAKDTYEAEAKQHADLLARMEFDR